MLSFQNPGLIPIEGFTIMGINAKDGDNPIGHFGTGVKIAIASILRMNGAITIWRGMDYYIFSTTKKMIRGKEFDVVVMCENGHSHTELGFTTELGKNWEPWMMMRELESNCRDEAGSSIVGRLSPTEGMTTIHVGCDAVESAYKHIDRFFIVDDPIYEHKKFNVHRNPNQEFFYRGIRVGMFQEPLPFTFDFKNPELQKRLTEDRTIDSYYVRNTLGAFIPEIDDPDILEELFPDKALLGILALDFDQHWTHPSEAFFERMKTLRATHIGAIPASVIGLLSRHDRINRDELYTPLPMDSVEQEMVDFGIKFLQDMGYTAGEALTYPIIKTTLGNDVMGMADRIYRRIYLAPDTFKFGKKFVASTIYEEFIHLHRGFNDCTREMQNHLFETMISIMEKHYYRRAI